MVVLSFTKKVTGNIRLSKHQDNIIHLNKWYGNSFYSLVYRILYCCLLNLLQVPCLLSVFTKIDIRVNLNVCN